MSEEAKLFILKEKLNDIREDKRNLHIIAFVFLVIFFFLWILTFSFRGGGLFILIGLVIVVIFGTPTHMLIDKYYNDKIAVAMQQAENIAYKPKCTKCGKEIPEGDFSFCPFCGESLTLGK